jgi:hypothetical protein
LEPFAFVTAMLIPNALRFDSDFWAALAYWVLLAVLPLMLPLTSMWLTYRRSHPQN